MVKQHLFLQKIALSSFFTILKTNEKQKKTFLLFCYNEGVNGEYCRGTFSEGDGVNCRGTCPKQGTEYILYTAGAPFLMGEGVHCRGISPKLGSGKWQG